MLSKSYRRKIKKRDYSSRRYSNPFFRKSQHIFPFFQNKLSIKFKIIIGFFIIIILMLVWFLFFSDFFLLNQVEINLEKAAQISKTNSTEIKNLVLKQSREQKRFLIFSQRNLLLFDKNKLQKVLNDKYCLENLEIKKKLPHSLIVNLKEKNYIVIWHEGDKFYYLSDEGDIVSEVQKEEIDSKKYPLINNLTNKKITNKKIGVDFNVVHFIINIFNNLTEKVNDIKIDRFKIDSDFYTIKVVLQNGPELYFNVKENLNKQIEKLLTIKSQRLKEDFFKKKYIDLRYGDRVYYR